jgi:hypothetical protein
VEWSSSQAGASFRSRTLRRSCCSRVRDACCQVAQNDAPGHSWSIQTSLARNTQRKAVRTHFKEGSIRTLSSRCDNLTGALSSSSTTQEWHRSNDMSFSTTATHIATSHNMLWPVRQINQPIHVQYSTGARTTSPFIPACNCLCTTNTTEHRSGALAVETCSRHLQPNEACDAHRKNSGLLWLRIPSE